MSNRRNASSDANEWAEKKRQQMERAKQLKEERKASQIRNVGDSIVGTSSKGFSSASVRF
jgi:hypothetical protein